MESVSAIRGSASGVEGHGDRQMQVSTGRSSAGIDGDQVAATGGGRRQAIMVDGEGVRGHVDEVVRSTVEATLNQLLD